jgi:hypothetical protein
MKICSSLSGCGMISAYALGGAYILSGISAFIFNFLANLSLK